MTNYYLLMLVICHETMACGLARLESSGNSGVEQGIVPFVSKVIPPDWVDDRVIWTRLLFAVLLDFVRETSTRDKTNSSEEL